MTDLSRYRYAARHAAPHNARTDREATQRAEGHAPRHSIATRCSVCSGGTDKACRACVAESQVGLVVVRHDAGNPMTRPDVRLLPLTGPQSPGRAW